MFVIVQINILVIMRRFESYLKLFIQINDLIVHDTDELVVEFYPIIVH